VGLCLRPACVQDAADVALLNYLSSQSQYDNSGYDISVGGSYKHQIEQIAALAVTNARSWFHYSHFVVVETEGRVVAGAAGFERMEADAAIPAALLEIGWTEEAISALESRLSPLYAAFPEEPAGYWTIDHVAVLPEWRGRGLGRRVVEAAMQRGMDLGYSAFKLDVFAGNVAARRLYEAAGFRVVEVFGGEVLRRLMDRDEIERMTYVL